MIGSKNLFEQIIQLIHIQGSEPLDQAIFSLRTFQVRTWNGIVKQKVLLNIILFTLLFFQVIKLRLYDLLKDTVQS